MKPWLQHAITFLAAAVLSGLGVQTANFIPQQALQDENDELLALVERLTEAHRHHIEDIKEICDCSSAP